MSATLQQAAAAYGATAAQTLSPVETMLRLYDLGVAACDARDARQASAVLVELIAALDFRHGDFPARLYALFEYALREVKAGRWTMPHRILAELRDAWRQALAPSQG
mgnify:CR=1 FL=1